MHNATGWSQSTDMPYTTTDRVVCEPEQKNQARTQTAPLTNIVPGKRVQVASITAERRIKHRLASLGLITGAEIEIVQSQCGPLLISLGDARLAIERTIAKKILVQPLEQQKTQSLSLIHQACSM